MAVTYEQMQAMHTLLEADNAREGVDALYPEGNADGYCKAEQDFFAEFKALLHNPKAFTWENSGDWAEGFGYDDYIRLVLRESPSTELFYWLRSVGGRVLREWSYP